MTGVYQNYDPETEAGQYMMNAEGAAGVLGLTGDVIAAGAALAGLILVYLGSVASEYAGFDATEQVLRACQAASYRP
jgi:hypothetical protein